MNEIENIVRTFCRENSIEIALSYEMPAGYETAYGTYDVTVNTLFLNITMLQNAPRYEVLFYLFHELRHAMQYQCPMLFHAQIKESMAYVILYDGTCYKLADNEWKKCVLDGNEGYFTRAYRGLPYEVDANNFAYERVKQICGDSAQLQELLAFWVPKDGFDYEDHRKLFRSIDAAVSKCVLTTEEICTYESCETFVKRFYGDLDFSDPMLTNEEQLSSNLLNAFRKPENHRVLGVYRADSLVGLFSFLVLPEEHYAEMLVGLSRELGAYREMLSYLEGHLPGYDVDFVFNPRNRLLRGPLAEKGAEFEAEAQKMVLGDSLPEFDTTGVELFSDRYAQQYFEIHNKDMYWTGEKVAAAPERFRTFLAIEDGQVVGYMDVTHSFEENEPFDIFVRPEFRGKGYGRKLLTKAIQRNAPKGMMLLVEVDNEPAIRLYTSVGFVKADGPNYLTAHWKGSNVL